MWFGIGLSPSCLEHTDIQVNIKLISDSFLTGCSGRNESLIILDFLKNLLLYQYKCLIMLASSVSVSLFPFFNFNFYFFGCVGSSLLHASFL